MLASILKEDYWRITLSGDSVVHRSHGIPEGSKLGPPCFNLLPNTLISRLRPANCGVATSGWVPAAWASHKWTGQGVPNQAEAAILARRVANQETLPSTCPQSSRHLWKQLARGLWICVILIEFLFSFTLMIQCFSLPVEVRLCGSYLLWPTGRMTSRLLRTWGHIRQSCKVSLEAQRGRHFWRNLCFSVPSSNPPCSFDASFLSQVVGA